MTLSEAKNMFMEGWANNSSALGMTKVTALIHAYFISSDIPVGYDEIIENLSISRGGVNKSIFELVNMGLIRKVYVNTGRKYYYEAERNPDEIIKLIIMFRKKLEFDPLLKMLEQIKVSSKKSKSEKEFNSMVSGIKCNSLLIGDALQKSLNKE